FSAVFASSSNSSALCFFCSKFFVIAIRRLTASLLSLVALNTSSVAFSEIWSCIVPTRAETFILRMETTSLTCFSVVSEVGSSVIRFLRNSSSSLSAFCTSCTTNASSLFFSAFPPPFFFSKLRFPPMAERH
ncbi:hypothetical protein PENTCL1PPCAC_19199, partial [Pristionchus entomophagus]